MKKTISILTLILIMSSAAFAQQSEKISLSENYTIENTSAYDLYLRAYDWLLTVYTTPGYEITKDEHNTNLIKVTVKAPYGKTTVQADLKFVIANNSCKLTISNFSDESQQAQEVFAMTIGRMQAVLQSELSPEAIQEIESKL